MNKVGLWIMALMTLAVVLVGGYTIFGSSVEAGKLLAQNNCGVCHDLTTRKVHERGPYLWGVYGRPAGSVEFPYSAEFRARIAQDPFVWDEAHLEEFITNPTMLVAGTRMAKNPSKHLQAFTGISDATNRGNLIAYLKTLH